MPAACLCVGCALLYCCQQPGMVTAVVAVAVAALCGTICAGVTLIGTICAGVTSSACCHVWASILVAQGGN